MGIINFSKISKNKYFIPVLIGATIALAGIWIGSPRNGEKTPGSEEKTAVVEIKGKKDLKSLIFGQKEFELTYADMDSSLAENIAFFESGEGWQGGGFLDWRNFYEGRSSLGIASDNRQPGTIFLEKSLDLSDFKIIEFFTSINDVKSLESAVIKFGDAALENYYSYSLPHLEEGWNIIRISQDQFIESKSNPDFSWKDVKKVQFEVISRPNTTAIINFDYLTALKNSEYLGKWKTIDENYLSLAKKDGKINLMARNEGAFQAILDGINGDNFTYQASFILQKAGAAGLFFRGDYSSNKGYYLLADGIDVSSCVLKKYGVDGWKDLASTEISNFIFEKNKKYWFKVETSGKKIAGFISVDGENFTELFNVEDDEFTNGGVGAAVFSRGYGFFDNFKFKQ